jgi:A/G-specific adenine glycosylase
MDFGAVICKPVNPLCTTCCFKKNCLAFQNNKINKLPVKEGKLKIKSRWFYYLIMEYRNKIYIKKRTGNDIWKNLYEFALIETEKKSKPNLVLKQAIKNGFISKNSYSVQTVSIQQSQLLSHQKISGQFIMLKLARPPAIDGLIALPRIKLTQYAFPGFINRFLTLQPEE